MEKPTSEKRKAELLRPETGKSVESRAGKKRLREGIIKKAKF